MPTRPAARKPTRRSTRASTAKSPERPPEPKAPVVEVLEKEREKARQRGQSVYDEEPASSDLPGLFPAHDGSYGINTLVPNQRKKRRGKPEFAKEDEEDQLFMREMLGRKGTKKARINAPSNQLSQATQASTGLTLTNAQNLLDDAEDELNAVEEELNELPGAEDEEDDPELFAAKKATVRDEFSDENDEINLNPTPSRPKPSRGMPPTRDLWDGPLGRVRNPLEPTNSPYKDNTWGEEPRQIYKASLPNPNITPYTQRRHPSEPPSSLSTKYGIPTGRASSVPLSPVRPDTSRSFNHESNLFGDARLHTPAPAFTTQPVHQENQQASLNKIREEPGRILPIANSERFFEPHPPRGMRGKMPFREHIGSLNVPGASLSREPLNGRQYVLGDEENARSNEVRENNQQGPASLVTVENKPNNVSSEKPPSTESPRKPIPHGVGIDPKPGLSPQVLTDAVGKAAEGLRRRTARPGADTEENKSPRSENLSGDDRRDRLERGAAQPVGHAKHSDREPSPVEVDNSSDGVDYLWPGLKLMVIFLGGTVALLVLFNVVSMLTSAEADPRPQWYGVTHWKENIFQFFPTALLHPLQSLGDADAQRLFGQLDAHDAELILLRRFKDTQQKKIAGIEAELPSVLRVEMDRNGKPRVPLDFWYALKDLMTADDDILTLKHANTASPEISKQHWLAVRQRLQADGSLPSSDKKGVARTEIESAVDERLASRWKSFVRQNANAINEILGHPTASKLTGMSDKEIKAVIEKTIKSDKHDMFVTRKDFADLVKKEMVSHEAEFRSELRDIAARIKEHSAELAKLQERTPGGMSHAEITDLVHAAVAKAKSNAKVEAMAKAGIRSQLEELETQVNFFSQFGGAVIDPTYSSKAWIPQKKTWKGKSWLDQDGYMSGYRPKKPIEALHPWHQEGECFCADAGPKGTGVGTNNISVNIPRDVIPQYLVVEHILPGATLDPGAMPRNIEIWASFDEVDLRKTVSGWSANQWPQAQEEKTLGSDFVKIGHMVYEKSYTGDGVQVFKFSNALLEMKAASSHVHVRAIDNYGADHTCFYRLRLFGNIQEREGLKQ